jgi:3-hydroxyacyl-[acyl-carrier-protein] dehydratase
MITKKGLELEEILPHRLSALMLDGVIYDSRDPHFLVASKKIDYDDPWLIGHFPGNPIYPGHCLVELACLAAAALVKCSFYEIQGLPIVARIGEVSFREPVYPGDVLTILIEMTHEVKGIFFTFNGKIVKEGRTVCEVKNLKGVANKIKKEAK